MTIVKRKADGTLWTPAGDCPYPLTGYNFVLAVKRKFLWFSYWTKDKSDRWIFYDPRLFEIIKDKSQL